MSWEDQGRQEHGYFGHGTGAPKAGTGSSVERASHDESGSAEVAAARAHAWAKAYGPALFGLPWSGAALDGFADAVRRRERARPGSIARALDRWAAQGKFGGRAKATRDGLLTLVSDTRDGRSSGHYNPLGVFIPGTPENEALTLGTERAIGAAGRAIGRVFNNEGHGGKGESAPATGSGAGEGSNPPEGTQETPPLPANPDDLLAQGWRETSDPEAAAAGHRTFVDPETGAVIRFDKGRPGQPGFEGQDHYHWLNPNRTGKRDDYLNQNGKPVARGSTPSHLRPRSR